MMFTGSTGHAKQPQGKKEAVVPNGDCSSAAQRFLQIPLVVLWPQSFLQCHVDLWADAS